MDSQPSRRQLWLIGASYAVVVVISALLVFARYLQYVWNPQDAAAAGGMWAGGDLMLEVFIFCLFLVPTAALVFVIRKSEAFYTAYAKVLLGLSLTAPLAVGIMIIPVLNQWYWGDLCIFRLFAIPVVALVLLCSWGVTSFARARRLISYALLIEGLTFVGIVGSVVLFS